MQPITKASLDPSRDNITYLLSDQLFDAVKVCPIKIPCKDQETNLTSLESNLRNARYFLTSITTRKPR
jgi:hypothetical protein